MSRTQSQVLILLLLISMQVQSAFALDPAYMHKMAYKKEVDRVVSPLALLKQLQSLAPIQNITEDSDSMLDCLRIDSNNATHFGVIEPSSGKANEDVPGPLFAPYFESCAFVVIEEGFKDARRAQQNAEIIFGRAIMQQLPPPVNWITLPLAQISPQLVAQIADRIILLNVGLEDNLRHKRFIGESTVYGIPLASQSEMRQHIIAHLTKSYANDSLLMFYMRMSVQLKLGPELKK